MLIIKFLTSAFVLGNGIVFNRLNGLMTRCLMNSIFDELKEGKYFTRSNRFQGSFNVKYFKEIKRFKGLQVKSVSYWEPKQTSKMELLYEYT